MKFRFNAKLFRWVGDKAAWHFVTVPKNISAKISKAVPHKRGWGSVPVAVLIGKTRFNTSVFPDSKAGTYLLRIKVSVRRAEGLEEGDSATIHIEIKKYGTK